MSFVDKFKKMNIANVIVSALFVTWIAAGCFIRNMEYFSSFFILSAIFGGTATCGAVGWKKYLKKTDKRVDAVFYPATDVQYLDAVRYAHEKMAATEWNSTDWVEEWKDCDDFADRMSTLMKEWFHIHVGKKEGYALGIERFVYTKADGTRHAIVECFKESGSIYFDVYPGNGDPLYLTDKQIDSAQWTNF